jgi:aryl-alcohol dehydrogenase-like predicted oxidoreductase
MEYTTLGRTELKVSVAGLGCGGFSRLGLSTGGTEASAIAIIHAALDSGVNLLDTAAPYGTEAVVGKAIKPVPRNQVVIATKSPVIRGGERWTPERVVASLDNSLRELGVDCIDVFQLHAVPPSGYDYVRDVIAPVLLREKAKGKFRFLGITETAPNDLEHAMLLRAIPDGMWDVAMVAFHLMNQNTREAVFPATLKHRIGTLLMFAVRSIFARRERVAEAMKELASQGEVPQSLADDPDPLGFLVHPGGATSLTDAAYRYVRHEPGVDVVLFGTGDQAHLRSNIESILRPPLPQADRDKLKELFSHLRGVGLVAPSRAR